MSFFGTLSAILRLSAYSGLGSTRYISTNMHPLYFKTTNILLAEPLKKKRKMDPAILRQREERRRRKLEKQIRRLEKNTKQFKPILEVEVPFKLIDEKEKRVRNLPALSSKVTEERLLIQKQWSKYKMKQHIADMQMVEVMMFSQKNALNELKVESEELYKEAVQLDLTLVPYSVMGPVCTPSIKNYDSPDGDYTDISKKWE